MRSATVAAPRVQRGEVRWELSRGGASFVFRRIAPQLLLLIVRGIDRGQLGLAPIEEIRSQIDLDGSLQLFVDAKGAIAVWPEVTREWTRFIWQERRRLGPVSVLVGSRAVGLAIEVAQALDRTGRVVQIHSDEDRFLRKLDEARERLAPGCAQRQEGRGATRTGAASALPVPPAP